MSGNENDFARSFSAFLSGASLEVFFSFNNQRREIDDQIADIPGGGTMPHVEGGAMIRNHIFTIDILPTK